MCALQPPFMADTIMRVSRKILIGKYQEIPDTFSSEVSNIIQMILCIDPNKRPNINEILSLKCLKERIKDLLNEEVFKDEFSHTILHN